MNKQDENVGIFVSLFLILDGFLIVSGLVMGSDVLFGLWVILLITVYMVFWLKEIVESQRNKRMAAK